MTIWNISFVQVTDLKRIWIYVLKISSTLLLAFLLSVSVFDEKNFNTVFSL